MINTTMAAGSERAANVSPAGSIRTQGVAYIPVTLRETARRRQPQVVGVMTAGELTSRYEIPRRDFRRKTGYQREVSKSRVSKLVGDLLKKRVDLPTAVLLNLRDYDPQTNLVRENGGVFFNPNGRNLFVVDGQHRIEALTRLVEDYPDEWNDFQIAFVCMLGATADEEMEEFYVVNSTAKSVRTDLALDLLRHLAEKDPDIMDSLLESGESWKVEAQAVTEDLSSATVWRGRIRFPGEPKGATTLRSNGFVASLRKPLTNHFFGAIQRQHRVQILDAFWRAVALVLPEAFADPGDYTLQKSTGVLVMNGLLIPAVEHLRSTGKSVIDSDSYVGMLEAPLYDLEGDTAAGGVAKGVDFWRSGAEGAAGSFSSNAGRRVLLARLTKLLPAPQVE